MTSFRCLPLATVIGVAALLNPIGMATTLAAQAAPALPTVRLHVRTVDHGTSRPIEGVALTLTAVDATHNVAAQRATTDERGRGQLNATELGRHVLIAQRLGYGERQDTIQFGIGQTLDVEIRLTSRPVELPAISVVSRSARLAEVGFHDRREGGLSGHYLTQLDVQRYRPRGLTDFFHRIPGTTITYAGPGQRVIRFRRWPSMSGVHRDGCVPDVYLDGSLLGGIAKASGIYVPRLNDYDIVSPNVIEGVEIYVGAATPLQYQNPCGVVLIWTRR